MNSTVSIVVPMHDEAANVAPLVAEVAAAFGTGPDVELILVDDASTDGTAAAALAAARNYPPLRVLQLAQRSGQSTAIWAGMQAARHTLVGILDGDRQNDPADLRHFVDLWADIAAAAGGDAPGLGLLIGERTRRQDSLLRRLSSRVANGVRRRLLDDGVRDSGCGLKLLPREVFRALPYFDHMHRFMPALVRQLGLRVVPVPVRHRARPAGTSKYGIGNRLWVGLVDLAGVAWLARRNRRGPVRELRHGVTAGNASAGSTPASGPGLAA